MHQRIEGEEEEKKTNGIGETESEFFRIDQKETPSDENKRKKNFVPTKNMGNPLIKNFAKSSGSIKHAEQEQRGKSEQKNHRDPTAGFWV